MRKIIRLCFVLLASFVSLPAAHGQTGPTSSSQGFDWIGSNPAAQTGATCLPAFQDVTGQWMRLATQWTPPGPSNNGYKPTSFTAIVGSIPNDTGIPQRHPSEVNSAFTVFIHDSFSRLTQNPNQGFRAAYQFSIAHVTFVQLPNLCQYCFGTTCTSTPCWKATVNLTAPDSVTYLDAQGNVTTQPFRLSGGQPYWFNLAPRQNNGADNTPCVAQMNENIPEYVSPMPSPLLTLPMTENQCNDGEIEHQPGQGCVFPLAHRELYMIQPGGTFPLCSPYGSFVNWTDSPLSPRWNPSFASPYRHCGWPTGGSPCCNRTRKGLSAYKLSVSLSKVFSTYNISSEAPAMAVDYRCPGGDC